ncbi:MAG: DNA-binding protein [Eubacterium sp.]|nr:DNA-binding protein [Eubacterium sp.]
MEKEKNPFEKYLSQKSELKADRHYKDGLFRFLFAKNRQYALDLYNGLNHTNYQNVEDLNFIVLESAFFIIMKNDVAFMFDNTLNLYEHQSSYNPNMPLRGFLYYADLYRKIINIEELYHSTLVKIPQPKYIVFYNGTRKLEAGDVQYLYLSDAFEAKESDNLYEWTAEMININTGHSKELLSKCKVLSEYSIFVAKVREYNSCQENLKDAILEAISYCLKNNILTDFLKKYKWEVAYLEWTDAQQEAFERVRQQEVDEERERADRAEAERDRAEAERDRAEAERNAALAKLDEVLARVDALEAELKALKSN